MTKIKTNEQLKKWTMALALALLMAGCAKYTPEQAFGIHDKLVELDCYEQHDLKSGSYITLKPTDQCLSVAYPDRCPDGGGYCMDKKGGI